MRVRASVAALAVCIALVTTACGASDDPAAEVGPHVNVDAFAELIAQPGVVILDVRTSAEVIDGRIPNSMGINLQAADFRDRLDALDRDATYAVYCRSGNRSREALEIMAEMGFTSVTGLEGGFIEWENAGQVVAISTY